MPRFNPYNLTRAEPVVDTREFSDPAQPGADFTLTLRAVSEAPFMLKVQAKGAEYVETYVLGRIKRQPKKAGELPLRDPPAPVYTRSEKGRTLIELDAQTCQGIAILDMMQVPQEGDAPYSFDEWAAMSVLMPTAFLEAANWAADMMTGSLGSEEAQGDDQAGEAEGAADPPEAHTAD